MKDKIRLDKYLFENDISKSLDNARKEIISGWVKVNGETIREPTRIITGKEDIQLARPGGTFVSRGGNKLQHALNFFTISVKDKTIADLGASTGGFTDCLLRNGAKKVYAVDVGNGILDYNLRIDPRVNVLEKTNARNLSKNNFQDIINFLTIDLSFISILKIFDNIKNTFSPIEGIILLKPQFEAAQDEHVKGVVKEKTAHINIINRVIQSLINNGMTFKGLHFSPIKGPAGNIEFLLYFEISGEMNNSAIDTINIRIKNVVNEAYDKLN